VLGGLDRLGGRRVGAAGRTAGASGTGCCVRIVNVPEVVRIAARPTGDQVCSVCGLEMLQSVNVATPRHGPPSSRRQRAPRGWCDGDRDLVCVVAVTSWCDVEHGPPDRMG